MPAPPTGAGGHPSRQSATASGPPNALQGFSQNRDKPIKISSASLEVRDKDKVATFSGDVHLVQGDTTLRSKTLVVFYDDESAPKPAKPPPIAGAPDAPISQQIRRVEAKGGVLVTQKDQTATGESGVFDMQANTVTLARQCRHLPGTERGEGRPSHRRSHLRHVAGRMRQVTGAVPRAGTDPAELHAGDKARTPSRHLAAAAVPAREAPKRTATISDIGTVLSARQARAVESRGARDYHPYMSRRCDGFEALVVDLIALFKRRDGRRKAPAPRDRSPPSPG